jgi:F5/8 type C domain
VQASNSAQGFPPQNAVDGSTSTYWSSYWYLSQPFPQTFRVDLGSIMTVSRIVLTLPSNWAVRTQTMAVSGALTTGGHSFLIVPTTTYIFDPDYGNFVTINFNPVRTRWIAITITGNSVAKSGQISEIHIYS